MTNDELQLFAPWVSTALDVMVLPDTQLSIIYMPQAANLPFRVKHGDAWICEHWADSWDAAMRGAEKYARWLVDLGQRP